MLERFADLGVQFGCNVQPDQVLQITADLGTEEAARALAETAYRQGAAFVDLVYEDPHVTRSRLLYASDDSLSYTPDWKVARAGARSQAVLSLIAPAAPELSDGVDPERAGRIGQGPDYAAKLGVVMERQVNWCVMSYPTGDWARRVYPELDADSAMRRLTEALTHVYRLDEDDPGAAWRDRVAFLNDVSGRLTQRRFDALRFEGPGTDLVVGLLPTSRFTPTFFETADGIEHMANLPSEEILSAPDPTRVDGVVRATMPLYFAGVVIDGLEIEFAGGRAVRIDADRNADALRAAVARHENGDRIGEVALVDGLGRIGPLDTVFYNTLLDENAASHLALGQAYAFTVDGEDRDRINTSAMHVDFMIGSEAVTASGRSARDAPWEPVLQGGDWLI